MANNGPVLIAAGGTGGHLFPAEALAHALARRDVPVHLATDERATRYGGSFPAEAVHVIKAATPTGGNLFARAWAVLTLIGGTADARALLRRMKPRVVVGFGGYPTVPPLLAATILGIPSILHEQNAVLGRANRLLARRVRRIATGFPTLGRLDPKLQPKCIEVGNPVRPAVLDAARSQYPQSPHGRFCLLVVGGSQGARVMSDIVPPAIEALPADTRARLFVVQQARDEDEARVREVYARLNVEAEIAPFFADLPRKMAEAHLVIARAGASTVSELAVIGRPAILVPYPHALDQDQSANAAHLAATGAVDVVAQSSFTPDYLSGKLVEALAHPENLTKRAAAAKQAGIPDAADRLADLVLEVAGTSRPESLNETAD
ncbi:MAG: undecaprenyldiphospho-muramoylpentapeptide beta-N-acetylglucosaminyltransferase [Methylobacteriaceae bacterium]|nr:undecaprenyldiphospho-muramoylpentapeptide beta-N-acetylglucosaminyltransferase [Methylobacteriaceae bacterium]